MNSHRVCLMQGCEEPRTIGMLSLCYKHRQQNEELIASKKRTRKERPAEEAATLEHLRKIHAGVLGVVPANEHERKAHSRAIKNMNWGSGTIAGNPKST